MEVDTGGAEVPVEEDHSQDDINIGQVEEYAEQTDDRIGQIEAQAEVEHAEALVERGGVDKGSGVGAPSLAASAHAAEQEKCLRGRPTLATLVLYKEINLKFEARLEIRQI